MEIRYYKSILQSLEKMEIDEVWLNNHLKKLYDQLPQEKLSETFTEKKKDPNSSSETENHKQIFADDDLYKKSWQKLNSIHKILKVKEFINNLKMDSEKDKIKLKDELVELIKDNNSQLNIQLLTNDNHTLNTKDLFFEPTLSNVGDKQILTMRLKAGANEYLEYQYDLKPKEYMVGFNLRSQGLNKVLNTSKPLDLEWDLKTYRNEKSINYENQMELYFELPQIILSLIHLN